MRANWIFRLWVALGALFLVGMTVEAAPFLDLFSPNRVKAEPNKTYTLEQKNGPWMIMACSFSGEGAEKQANELVYEFRNRNKLPAYVYKHTFDPGEAPKRCLNERGNVRQARYAKYQNAAPEKARHPEIVEIAVLVGNFASLEDNNAKETLKRIRLWEPEALKIKEGKPSYQTLGGLRYLQKQAHIQLTSEREQSGLTRSERQQSGSTSSEKQKLGPMGHAMFARNPLLPAEYFKQSTLDDEIIRLNKGEDYNLLECQAKYTVKVATFTGAAVISPRDVREIEDNKLAMKSQLDEAAKTADTLVHALRKKGYEAYQYHDRESSVVTVGGFDSPGVMQPNGQMEWNHDVAVILAVFGPKTQEEINPKLRDYVSAHQLNSVTNYSKAFPLEKDGQQTGEFIPLDIQPQVVPIPRKSFSRSFQEPE